MRLFAHRGFADVYPENTLGAIERASVEADGVEIDVRRCRSNEPVVIHDATIDRVTERSGRVADLSAAQLADLNVLGTGEGVSTLETAIDVVPEDTAVNVELKDRGMAAEAIAAADAVENEVIVSSFDADALAEMYRNDAVERSESGRADLSDSGVSLAYLADVTPRTDVRTARELGCSYLHANGWLCLCTSVVARSRKFGMEVNAWTANWRLETRLLAYRGVDGVIADRPDLL
jgi:glycerophosphoryl diester phosphodiesterase